MPGFHITTQDDLAGQDGDEPYVLFVNETEYGNRRFLRTNVLSARPDLKKFTALRFRQEVKRHADAVAPGEDVVVVFMEAQELEPPLTLVCSDLHLEMEGYPVEQGAEIEIPIRRAAGERRGDLGEERGFWAQPLEAPPPRPPGRIRPVQPRAAAGRDPGLP